MGTRERRVREKRARRRAVLSAAEQLFLQQGVSATTIDQIAERAELSKGAIYLYFRSKEELCLALLVEASRVFVDEMKTARADELPPLEQLQRMIRTYYAFYLRRSDYFRLLFVIEHQSYRGPVADELHAEWTALGKEALGMLAGIVEKGIEQGAIRPVDPWTTAVSLWTAVTGVIVLSAQEIRWEFLGQFDQRQLVTSTVQNFLTGIAAIPGPTGTLRTETAAGTQPTSRPRRTTKQATKNERPKAASVSRGKPDR